MQSASRLWRLFAAAVVVASTLSAIPGTATAERHHEVRSGQTLSTIARRYRITVNSLAAANGLTSQTLLKQGTVLRVPEPGVVYIARGQTLAALARMHGVEVATLARANRIRVGDEVFEGQRLVLPGASAAPQRELNRDRGETRRARGTGAINMYRVCTKERVKLRVLDANGHPRRAARSQLARLLRPRGSSRTRLPPPRLLQLLKRVSDRFDGRTLVIISGYRTPGRGTSKTSRHAQGRAIDFKVEGISNKVLRDYLRTFPNVGVGYYPRSTFVHLDVRGQSAYWVDWSGPGEAAITQKRGQGTSLAAQDEAEELDDTHQTVEPSESDAPLDSPSDSKSEPDLEQDIPRSPEELEPQST